VSNGPGTGKHSDVAVRQDPRTGRRGRPTSGRALERLLRERAEQVRTPSDVNAVLALDLEDADGWTARVTEGRIEVEPGLPDKPDVRVTTRRDTLAEVVSGQRSGVEAFLAGDLVVRGNLALALRFDSLFNPDAVPTRWPRFGTLRARGVRTAYLEAGEGPPVVLLHGLGATNASMLPTLWDLARDHRVIAPDLPGFGDSGKPVRAYHAQFYARWLSAFLGQLGVDRAHLVGNSMGGRVALEMGLEHPDRVDRMVLLMPSPAFIRGREWVRVVRFLRPELALIPVRLTHRQVVLGIRSMFGRPARLPAAWYDAAADEFLRVFRSPTGRVAFFSAARQIYLEEPHGERGFWDRLPAMERPALFLWGERDRLVPARFARHVERALPDATSVVLEDCGHVPQYELPDRTHRMIREFLGSPA
jgi:pimeloyl-ACP methyl ester carboxylesterase/putative sterol carrier protein